MTLFTTVTDTPNNAERVARYRGRLTYVRASSVWHDTRVWQGLDWLAKLRQRASRFDRLVTLFNPLDHEQTK